MLYDNTTATPRAHDPAVNSALAYGEELYNANQDARAEAEGYAACNIAEAVKDHGLVWVLRQLAESAPGEGFGLDEVAVPGIKSYLLKDQNSTRRLLYSIAEALHKVEQIEPYIPGGCRKRGYPAYSDRGGNSSLASRYYDGPTDF